MTFPHSHKTVVVLDRSPHFLSSSNEFVEFDVFAKSRAPGMIPLAPIAKTLWTCTVEAAVEYARIVYDVFPKDRLISIIASDTDSSQLNTWASGEQNLQQMLSMLAHLGPPTLAADQEDCSIMPGLTKAIEVLTIPTETQEELLKNSSREEILNNGRIICMTSMKSEAHFRSLEECVMDALNQHNKLAEDHATLLPVDDCELLVMHIVPVGPDSHSHVTHSLPKRVSDSLTSELRVSQSGHFIAQTMVTMTLSHYNLASTTVTGIPMKEEQNASSSANYDVELLHAAEAHPERTETVTLKWCTPKSSVVEMQQCSGAYRISPVDVNSRPSSCLTNFLLNGRSVMLEQPKKSGTRVVSHMLTSHGGEIYIHTLASARSILEDPPSISEGCGGRVTDYRINDFGELMKDCRLVPSEKTSKDCLPIDRAKQQLERMTRHWPMVIGDTIIFNMMSHLDPLLSLIVKEQIDDDEVLECKKAIYHVMGMESRNEPLPIPPSGSRGKGPKREEQYRQMWNELEHLIQAHCKTSANHQKVLECLLELRKPPDDVKGGIKKSGSGAESIKEEKPETMEVEDALKDYDKYQRLTEREKQDLNKADIKPPRSPPSKRVKLNLENSVGKGSGGTQKSLLSLWTNKIKLLHSQRHQEFAGREESSGPQAELYQHMKEPNSDSADVKPSLLNIKTSLSSIKTGAMKK